jgi:hypothetical protein
MLRCDLNNRNKTAMRAQRTIEILEALVGFDTTSRNSNLALVEWSRPISTGSACRMSA